MLLYNFMYSKVKLSLATTLGILSYSSHSACCFLPLCCQREQAQNLQTHTKIINATYVTEFPSIPLSPLLSPDYLNKASLFGGQKLLGELMFFGRERMPLWSLSRSCQHHRCCSSAYLFLLLWSHTQHGHNTQYTHTRGTHCCHTQVIIVKPSQTKHDLLNGSIPFNLFPINWKKSNGHCTISQVAKRERVQERGIQRRVEEQQD